MNRLLTYQARYSCSTASYLVKPDYKVECWFLNNRLPDFSGDKYSVLTMKTKRYLLWFYQGLLWSRLIFIKYQPNEKVLAPHSLKGFPHGQASSGDIHHWWWGFRLRWHCTWDGLSCHKSSSTLMQQNFTMIYRLQIFFPYTSIGFWYTFIVKRWVSLFWIILKLSKMHHFCLLPKIGTIYFCYCYS